MMEKALLLAVSEIGGYPNFALLYESLVHRLRYIDEFSASVMLHIKA